MSDIPYCLLAYDKSVMRPACVLLQPMYGGTVSGDDLGMLFPNVWLLSPTDNMELFSVWTRDELVQIARMTEEAHHGST